MHKKTFIILTLLGITTALFGQSRAELMGDSLFKYHDYQQARDFYHRAVKKNPSPSLHLKLAETHHQLGEFEAAVGYYDLAGDKIYTVDPSYALHYAQDLHIVGNHHMAKEVVNKINEKTGLATYSLDHETSSLWEIQPVAFNTEHGEFSPVVSDEKLFFVSNRPDGNVSTKDYHWDGEAYLDIFSIPISDITLDSQQVSNSGNQLNSLWHDGPATFTADGRMVIFSRTYESKPKYQNEVGTRHFGLFICHKQNDGSWSEPESFAFNNTEYSVGYPALSPDGQVLVFASDMEGGNGGFDLYITSKENSTWSTPSALPDHINSAGNEVFPGWKSNYELCFSSDGHNGKGGLDIYSVTKNGEEWSARSDKFSALNTLYDEFGIYSLNEQTLLFSSNRNGSDDIYKAEQIEVQIKLLVKGEEAEHQLDQSQLDITLNNSNATLTRDADGNWMLLGTPGEEVSLQIGSDGYQTKQLAISFPESNQEKVVRLTTSAFSKTAVDLIAYFDTNHEMVGYLNSDSALYEISLRDGDVVLKNNEQEIILSRSISSLQDYFDSDKFEKDLIANQMSLRSKKFIDNIYFDYDQYSIRNDATTELDKVVEILKVNPALKIAIGAHTDMRGSINYNLKLSKNRALATIAYLKEQGISPDRISYKGFGKQKPVRVCDPPDSCSEQLHELNRRAEFVLYYDRDPYKQELQSKTKAVDASRSNALYDKVLSKYGQKKAPDLTFRIAIGAYRHNHELEFAELADLGNVIKNVDQNGIMWYYLGEFDSMQNAETIRKEVIDRGISGAYITYFQSGKRISYQKFVAL